jgi:hypothetical protein
MIDYLLESPWQIGLLGAILTAVAIYGWLQSGDKRALWSSVAIAVVSIALVLISVFIDTDREIIRRFVFETAHELEQNQTEKVIAKIHPLANEGLLNARARLPSIRFLTAKVKTIHGIEVTSHRTGRSATVRMNVYVDAEYDGRQGRAPRWVQLVLEESEGRWMIVSFEQHEPHYEMLNERGRQQLDRF